MLSTPQQPSTWVAWLLWIFCLVFIFPSAYKGNQDE